MPTIRRCAIVGCLSNSRQSPQLQFFQFPRPENPFHKLWKQACHASLSRILPFKKPVICALHFHPNCIGGRRLTASAVPSLRMEVPSNLKAVEQQAMVEEIERSRKCAYINAVVFEWLVRANLNPQLRGSITHGMIKEKADAACSIIGSKTFVADNRWLNRFRETHLSGFAQKLSNNQLKPIGPSLWIPDIVQDLQHLFPPTSADRVANLETMPEQYIDYMQQYGEEEEDDDQDQSQDQSYPDPPQQQNHYQSQQQHHSQSGYDAYGQHHQQGTYSSGGYDSYYYDRQNQQQNYPHQQQNYSSPNHQQNYTSPHMQQNYPSPHQQQRSASNSPPQPAQTQLPPPSRPASQHQASPSPVHRASPLTNPVPVKRSKVETEDEEVTFVANGNGNSNGNDNTTEEVEDLTDECEVSVNAETLKAKIAAESTPIRVVPPSPSPSPKPLANSTNIATNGQTNGHATPKTLDSELLTYTEALDYLRPLEDFALFKENFRAIGLLSQLEMIFRKGDRRMANIGGGE